jgi:RIO-like serine/threonine protein kinase
MVSFTQNDIRILRAITNSDRTKGNSKFTATTLKEIEEVTGFSHQKVRSTIIKFLNLGYVQEGFKNGKQKTYMLTKEGYEFLKEAIINILEVISNE